MLGKVIPLLHAAGHDGFGGGDILDDRRMWCDCLFFGLGLQCSVTKWFAAR